MRERKKPIVEGRIAELRKARGKTQEKFAEEIGVSTNTISRIEQRTMSLSSDVALKIADTYGVSLDWLFYREDKMESPKVQKARAEAIQCIESMGGEEERRTIKLKLHTKEENRKNPL